LATQVVKDGYMGQDILDKFSRKTIHSHRRWRGRLLQADAGEERQRHLAKMRQSGFALSPSTSPRRNVFPSTGAIKTLGVITTGASAP